MLSFVKHIDKLKEVLNQKTMFDSQHKWLRITTWLKERVCHLRISNSSRLTGIKKNLLRIIFPFLLALSCQQKSHLICYKSAQKEVLINTKNNTYILYNNPVGYGGRYQWGTYYYDSINKIEKFKNNKLNEFISYKFKKEKKDRDVRIEFKTNLKITLIPKLFKDSISIKCIEYSDSNAFFILDKNTFERIKTNFKISFLYLSNMNFGLTYSIKENDISDVVIKLILPDVALSDESFYTFYNLEFIQWKNKKYIYFDTVKDGFNKKVLYTQKLKKIHPSKFRPIASGIIDSTIFAR